MDEVTLIERAERITGEPAERTLFRTRHLSLVVGLQLRSGRQVVAKARAWDERLVACSRVHHWLAGRFPCAKPIGDLERFQGQAVSVEELVPGGIVLARSDTQIRSGEITDGATIAAYTLLLLHQQ